MFNIVDIFIGFKTDAPKLEAAEQDFDNITSSIERMEEAVSAGSQTFGAMEDIFSRVAAQGVALWGGLFIQAGRYVDKVGEAEATSRQWLETTERMQESQVELGRKSAAALTPYRDALADILDKAAALDPRIFQAGAAIGGGLLLVGTIGIMTAQVGRMVVALIDFNIGLQRLLAAQNLQGGIARGGVRAGVGLGAIGLGAIIGEQIAQELVDEDFSLGDGAKTIGQALLITLSLVGKGLHATWVVMNKLNLEIDKVVIRLKEGFDNLVNVLKKAALDLSLAVLEQSVLGQSVGDIVGVDTAGMRAARDAMGGGESSERERLARAVHTADTMFAETGLDIWRQASRQLMEDLVALGPAVDKFAEAEARFEQRNAAAAGVLDMFNAGLVDFGENIGVIEDARAGGRAGRAPLSPEEMGQVLDDFEQLQEDMVEAEEDFLEQRADDLDDFHREVLEAEASFQRAQQRATEDFQHSQELALKDFQRNQAQSAADFATSQERALQDFNEAAADSQEEYQKERAVTLDNQQDEELKRLEAFQRERQRAEEDHRDRLSDAASRLDAAAVFQELQSFQKDKRRAQEDFDEQGKQAADQLKETLDDQQKAHTAQRALAREQFMEQQRDAERDFQEQQRRGEADFERNRHRQEEEFERGQVRQRQEFAHSQAQRREDFDRRRREAVIEFREMQQERQNAFRKQVRDLIRHNLEEAEVRQRHYNRLRRQLAAFMLPNLLGAKKSFHTGGITPGGMVNTQAGEGILDVGTTQALQKQVGSFNMPDIRQFVEGGRSVGNVNVTINAPSPGSSADQIAQATRVELGRVLTEFVG